MVNVSVTLYRIVCYSIPYCGQCEYHSIPCCSQCQCYSIPYCVLLYTVLCVFSAQLLIPRWFKQVYMFLSRLTFPCPHHVNKVHAVAYTPLVQTGVHVSFCLRVVPVHARIMLIIMSVELRIPHLLKQVHMSSFASYLSMSASYQFIRGVAHTPLVQTGARVFIRVVPVYARIMLIMSVELRIPRLFKQVHMSSFASYLSSPHHIKLSRPYSSAHPACPNRCACRVLPT